MSMPRALRLGLFALAAAGFAPSARAAAVDPALFQDLRYRLIGPFRGGRVLAVAGVPGEPSHFYFGSVNGGVWETNDAGRTWQPIFDAQPIGSIGALALAPSNPRVLYVGTGEADMRSDIAQGDGMYKSTDGGRTWAHIGLRDTQQIGRVLVHPHDPNLVYVAALGHPYGPNPERGVFRSRDGGRTWQKILFKDDDTGATDLAFEPGRPEVIYAALWQTRRPPWNIYPPSSGPGSGVYKSIDGGDTWKPLAGHGLPAPHGRVGLAVAPSAPQRVYAMVDAREGGLYRSDDGGTSFARVGSDPRIWSRGWYFGGVAVHPANADIVYACNVNLYRSDDGGRTFVPTKGAPGGDDYHELWIDPKDPARQILGVDQGAVVTLNGGLTWSSWFNQPTGQFYHVSTDRQFPYWVYGSQQDSGAATVPSRTASQNGINMTHYRETTAGGESDNVAPDPKDPNILFGGRVSRLDLRTDQTQEVDPTLAYPDLHRSIWTMPLVFSSRDPRVLYFANQRLFRTEDGGQHWTVISPDLTREAPEVPKTLDPPTVDDNEQRGPRRGVIYAIAPSRMADRDLWVGTDDGLIWRTRDEGGHWDDVTPRDLTSWSKVGILEASHFDAETAYAAVDRHRLDDAKPYVYRTRDGGKSWQLVAAGIPEGSFVNAVREDPVRRGLLYAGTEKGVYVSFDDGEWWQPLQQNLPVTSVRDLDVHGDDLVVATHGRAFWILDDVSPLRQIDTKLEASRLFRPAVAVRLRSAGFTGTPLPKDEPMASNPPEGAVIDYVLKEPAQKVTLAIQDAQGGTVDRYSSDDAVVKVDLARISVAPEWAPSPRVLSKAAGMHRFVWPLRYALPETLGGAKSLARGLWAPPGRYTVELVIDGTRHAEPLAVEPDPRVSLSVEAYVQQHALGREIEAASVQVAAAGAEMAGLQKKLGERRAAATGSAQRTIDALRIRLAGLSGLPESANPADAWFLPPKAVTSLHYLGGVFEKLAVAVDGADASPTPDAQAGLAQARATLRTTLLAWEKLKVEAASAARRGAVEKDAT